MWFTLSYASAIKKLFDPVVLVCRMSIVWEDTDGCVNKYSCSLDIYLMTLLSYLYGIITDSSINAPGRVSSVFDGINAMYKRYLN